MRRLPVEEFSPCVVPAGEKEAIALDIGRLASGQRIFFPTLFARGSRPGQLLVAVGGVHGDEFEGPAALMDFFAGLDTRLMSGSVICTTVVNGPAFEAGSRSSPIDGANLARVFPGSASGSISERIAFHLLEHVVSHADLFIDLHSGGRDYAMPAMSGFYLLEDEVGQKSRAAALAFGAEVVWASALNHGRSISEAVRRGIPSIYAEASGGARLNWEDVELYRTGLTNLLKHLNVLPGEPARRGLKYFATTPEEDYWRESSVLADASGLYRSRLGVLAEVDRGQELGRVVNLFGEPLQTVRANRRGRIMAQRIFPRVHAGDALVVIA